MNGAEGTCKKRGVRVDKTGDTGGVKKGGRPSNKKAPAKEGKKGGARCLRIVINCGGHVSANKLYQAQPSGENLAVQLRREARLQKSRDRLFDGRGQGAQSAAADASSDLSEKPTASFKPVICAVTGKSVGLKDLSTESKTPLLSELTPSNSALSPIAAVETAQSEFSAGIYLLLLPSPYPIRHYSPPEHPPQLVSPATQLARRLGAVAAIVQSPLSPVFPQLNPHKPL